MYNKTHLKDLLDTNNPYWESSRIFTQQIEIYQKPEVGHLERTHQKACPSFNMAIIQNLILTTNSI